MKTTGMKRFIAVILSATGLAAAAESEMFRADTRGFGAVTVSLRQPGGNGKDSWTTFQAEDAAHAKIIASKRLAD
ncbi:MAG: hypothetical protein WCJ02_15005, partial [bacterium]